MLGSTPVKPPHSQMGHPRGQIALSESSNRGTRESWVCSERASPHLVLKPPQTEGGGPAGSDLDEAASIDWPRTKEGSRRAAAAVQISGQKFRCPSKPTLGLPRVPGGLLGAPSKAPEGYIPG